VHHAVGQFIAFGAKFQDENVFATTFISSAIDENLIVWADLDVLESHEILLPLEVFAPNRIATGIKPQDIDATVAVGGFTPHRGAADQQVPIGKAGNFLLIRLDRFLQQLEVLLGETREAVKQQKQGHSMLETTFHYPNIRLNLR
jgi:hypothetical protein